MVNNYVSFYLILVAASLSGCVNEPVQQAIAPTGYIYDGENVNVAEVINLQRKSLRTMSKHNADLDRDSEFGGAIEICSTPKLFCVKGALNILVPKASPLTDKWSYEDLACKRLELLGEGVVRFTCSRQSDPGLATVVDYSSHSGVVSYFRTGSYPGVKYRSRSDVGLFGIKSS